MSRKRVNWPIGISHFQHDKISFIFLNVCFCCSLQTYNANVLFVVPVQLKIKAGFGVGVWLSSSLNPSLLIKKWNPLTTLKLTEEKVGSSLQDISTGDHFPGRTSVAQTIRESLNKWDLLKLRSFCKAKDTISKTKRLPSDWEKIFFYPSSDKGLISKIYKELKNPDTKTLINPIKKWGT